MIIHNMQQGSEEWHKLRIGMITGTRLKAVCGKDNLSLIDEMIAEVVVEEKEEIFTSVKMQRGTDFEPIAKAAYEEFTGLNIINLGFCQSEEFTMVGMSPDGYVLKGCSAFTTDDLTHAIEIKCPDTKTHVKYIRMNKLPVEYFYQILMYFIVNPKLEKLDFVSFDNRFLIKPIHIIPITRAELEFEIDVAKKELVKFEAKYNKYYNELTF